ncbi:MAG: c-type cytochrome [Planctomycetota bacterium]|nr:c-type cytochrome [Planctomycetota bacterium]
MAGWLVCAVIVASAPQDRAGDAAQVAKDRRVVETLLRLKGIKLNSNPKWKAAVRRHLRRIEGRPKYFELVERFELRDESPQLLQLARAAKTPSATVSAVRLLLKFEQQEAIRQAFKQHPDQAPGLISSLGLAGGVVVLELLQPLVTDDKQSLAVRSAAARAVGRNLMGQQFLLGLVRSKSLARDLHFTVADVLFASPAAEVRDEVARYLKLPAAKGKPLPPVSELVERRGDKRRGAEIFRIRGTCAKCHKVRGTGKEVGPDLSEIGSKLSSQALYVSILDPSAGISHNYESYIVVTAEGTVLTGVKVSESGTRITIKTAEAVERTFAKEDLEEVIKQPTSLMPEDLQKNLSAEDLVDLVEYLKTLKKVPAGVPSAKP